MGMVMTALLQRCLVTEQMLGAPRHDVCLTRWNIDGAVWASIGFLCPMRRNLTNEPFGSTTKLLAGSPVREPRHIARWLLCSTLVLARATLTRHA